MAWRIGIDIGGTFTDVAMVEEDTGRIGIAKVLTTPRDFGQGVIDGIRRGLAENAIDPADVALLSHATTVVTNALLEHKGARCGFIATRGFRDLLELRRSSRPDLYDLFQDGPSDPGAAAVPVGDHRTHRCAGGCGHTAGRGRDPGA